MVVQHCEILMPLTYTLKMVKVVNFMLCLFSHGENIIYLYY